MNRWFLLLFCTGLMFSQDLKVHKDTVYVKGKKVALISCTSMRYSYELYDLDRNLLLKAKALPCKKCEETNAIDFEFSSAKYGGIKRLTTLEESFNRGKELIRLLYNYGLIDDQKVSVETLFASDNLKRIYLQNTIDLSPKELPNNLNYYIVGLDVYTKNEKVGFFKKDIFYIDFKTSPLQFERITLLDNDGNFVAVYNKLKDAVQVVDNDFFAMKDALFVDCVVLRNGVVFKSEAMDENQVFEKMLAYSVQNNFELGNQINNKIQSKVDNLRIVEYDKNIFLGSYQNEFGLCTFKNIPGFNDGFSVKNDGRALFFKPLKTGKNDISFVLKGRNDVRFSKINYLHSSDYIAFDIQNNDIFEKYDIIKSVYDWELETYCFREIVFENEKFLIVSDGSSYVIKNKKKNKGFRLYVAVEKYIHKLGEYLDVNNEVLKNLNVKSLSSIIALLNSIEK